MSKLNSRSYFLLGLIMVAAIGVFGLYINEFHYFDRTLNLRQLIIPALIVAGILGLGIGIYVARKTKDLVDRIRIQLFFLFGSLLLTPVLASLLNRAVAWNYPREIEAIYAGEVPFIADIGIIEADLKDGADGFFLYFYWEGQLFRIKNKSRWYEDLKKGEKIILQVGKGLLGTWVVWNRPVLGKSI